MSATTVERGLHIAALFNHDWSHEFDSFERGEVPSHRLFGLAGLMAAGHRVSWLSAGSGGHWRLRQLRWLWSLRGDVDVVVATHEAAAVPALLLKRLGLLRVPFVVLTVAATAERHRTGPRGWVVRRALAAAERLTVFASAQRELLAERLGVPAARVSFVRFGADDRYFAARGAARTRSVVAVGTNEGKDYVTLVRALPEGLACTIVADERNLDLCRPHIGSKAVRLRSAVPIVELRDLYATAGVVVIALHEVDFSSGQTVLAENALLGSPLVVSDVSGVRDYAPEAVRVPPGDVEALRTALTTTLARPPTTWEYSDVASADDMSRVLETLVREAVAARSTRPGRPARSRR